jgi:hypothetical protein
MLNAADPLPFPFRQVCKDDLQRCWNAFRKRYLPSNEYLSPSSPLGICILRQGFGNKEKKEAPKNKSSIAFFFSTLVSHFLNAADFLCCLFDAWATSRQRNALLLARLTCHPLGERVTKPSLSQQFTRVCEFLFLPLPETDKLVVTAFELSLHSTCLVASRARRYSTEALLSRAQKKCAGFLLV